MQQKTAQDKCQTILNGRWTKQEHSKFLQGLQLFGKNWKKIQSIVKTRSGSQIRSHAQKFFNKLERKYQNSHYLLPLEASETHFQNQDSHLPSFQKTNPITIDTPFTNLNQETLKTLQLANIENKMLPQQGKSQNKQKKQEINVLKPRNSSQSYYFDQIWKYPQQVIQKNFIRTLVDLKCKRTANKFQQSNLQYTCQNNCQNQQNPILRSINNQSTTLPESLIYPTFQQNIDSDDTSRKRKRSFVLCQNQEESVERLNSFRRCRIQRLSHLEFTKSKVNNGPYDIKIINNTSMNNNMIEKEIQAFCFI